MRITGGVFRGRRLKTAEGPGYRPATSRVREALYSMLAARGLVWQDLRVLDVFAGSGSLGMEALSRGAGFAAFLELDRRAAGLIATNLRDLGVHSRQWEVLRGDARKLLEQPPARPFGLVFVDPPYGLNLLPETVRRLLEYGWLAPGAFLVAETEAPPRGEVAEDVQEPELSLETDKLYGQTRIRIWVSPLKSPSSPEPSIP